MARLKLILARALVLYVALLPLFGMPVEAQGRQLTKPPLPDPLPERPVPGESVFTAIDQSLNVKSFNGFNTSATAGYFSHDSHSHDGGVVRIDSPWGEQLEIRYWMTPHGVSFEYDDDLKVRYRFDEDGTLQEIVAESPFRESRMLVGNRGELLRSGQLDFETVDLSAYEVVEEALRAKHSDAFLAGLQRAEGAIQASCATDVILCLACIVAWANTIPAVGSVCVVGGVPTFGAACLLAILVHEAAGYACAITCADMIRSCGGRPRGDGPIPDGCEP